MLRVEKAQQVQEGEILAIPLAPPRDELVIPLPKGSKPRTHRARKAPPPKLEELLAPDPMQAPPGNQRCLALMMQSAGHSLDLGCRLCFTNCVYAPPCGCKGWDCIDRQQREPLVVFTETVRTGPRGWKRLFLRKSEAESPSGLGRVIRRLLMPWTWFSRP